MRHHSCNLYMSDSCNEKSRENLFRGVPDRNAPKRPIGCESFEKSALNRKVRVEHVAPRSSQEIEGSDIVSRLEMCLKLNERRLIIVLY